jgi:rubrerythrin
MDKEETSMLLASALAEEFQMIDTYSQVLEVCFDNRVRDVLKKLVSDSRYHAREVSSVLLKESGNLEISRADKIIAEQVMRTPEFQLAKASVAWYKEKLSGMDFSSEDEILNASEITEKLILETLGAFKNSERKAHAIYALLNGALPAHTKTFSPIMNDELTHAGKLSALIYQIKTGRQLKQAQANSRTPVGMFYCAACLKLSDKGIGKCDECKGEIESLK